MNTSPISRVGPIALACLFFGASAAIGGIGYLPMVGPTPLRFASERPVLPVKLPPVSKGESHGEPAAAAGPNLGAQPSSAPGIVSISPAAHSSNTNGAPANNASEIAAFPSAQTTSAEATPPFSISPEMLAHLFTQRMATNQGASVEVPIHFNPAFAPVAPSSSATYTSPSKP